MSALPSEDQTVLPATLLDDVTAAPTLLDVSPSAPVGLTGVVGTEATVFVDDRVAAFQAVDRAATVLDAAEAATLLDPHVQGRRAPRPVPTTGDATAAPAGQSPASSDGRTAPAVPRQRPLRPRDGGRPGQHGHGPRRRDLELLRRVALKELSLEVAHDRSAARASSARCR
jgi:hypothetical protein